MKLAGLILALLVALVPPAFADELEATGSVYTISIFNVKQGQVNAYLAAREQAQPMVRQNEFIKSRKVFRHAWGPEWSVMVVTEYGSLTDIEKAAARTEELYRKAFPDKVKQDQRRALFDRLLIGHSDAIVREVPQLGK